MLDLVGEELKVLAEKLESLVRASGIERPHVATLIIDHLAAILSAAHHDGGALKASLSDLLNAGQHVIGGNLGALGPGVHGGLDGGGNFRFL